MLHTQRLKPDEIERAAQLLKEGNVIAFPTETVYGLGAPIFNPHAVAQIFSLKGRPSDNPLIVHICDLSQIQKIAIDIPESFYALASVFFPGPCTVVLKRHPNVPPIVSAGMDTIAIRMPSNPIARRLIAATGEPLAAPSANLSGRPSATTCDHVLEDFAGKIAAVIDGGKTEFGIESTVLSLVHNPPLLLRPGTIHKAELEKAMGCSVREAGAEEHERALAPGMKYRHYCPDTPIRLFHSQEELLLAAAREERPMILTGWLTEHSAFGVPHGDHFFLIAQELYALLRLADAKKYSCILVLCDEQLLSDSALKNRLFRACGI
jgi:L-threonylcarbamoyladenylate synthase